jgi:protein-tyrosine phosphatase
VETLTRHGYDISHTARQITHDWFEQIDLVLAMDISNYANLQVLMEKTDAHSELRMLRSFDPALSDITEPDPELDVPDPYYGGPEGFDLVLDMIERAVDGLVRELPARIEAAK